MAHRRALHRQPRPASTRAVRALAISGLTTDEDVEWLATNATQRKVIVEIGPYLGRSTRALADANRDGIVYSVDYITRPEFSANCSDLIERGRVVPIECDSRAGLPAVLRGVSVDMLWIDGDHRYEAVASDIRNFAPLVRKGGLICGHDYCVWHPEVVQAVDDAYGARVETIDIHRSIWWVTA